MQPSSRRLKRLRGRVQKQNIYSYLLRGAVIGVIAMFVLGLAAFAFFSRDLPEPGKIQRREGFSTVFTDRNDKVLFEMLHA